ncbi:hypothetical protein FACS1894116_14280 [Betaproteobacteria bacterium]|nr:hypothetical protein FACS1894116_14280 [Betaproteobacteria bacterium]
MSMAGKIVRHKGFDMKRIAGAFDTLFKDAVPMTSEPEKAKEGHKDHTRNITGYHQYVSKFTQDAKEIQVHNPGPGVKMWEIVTPKGRHGYLFENKNGEVWIDVASLKPGEDIGNIIYGIAEGYAHNNGKQFIGDPMGLSPTGFYRRLENMISSALRYGTTDHLKPHEAQTNPTGYYSGHDKKFADEAGEFALDWKQGLGTALSQKIVC